MELKIITTVLVMTLLLVSLFVLGAGCVSSEEASAEDLDSELEELENMNQALDDFELEINDSELEIIEDLF